MWNSRKSLNLSWVCTKCLIAGIFVFAALLPEMLKAYVNLSPAYSSLSQVTPLMVELYLCCIPALAALIALDRLLTNLRKDVVFVRTNVSLLRVISWCCFVVALLAACAVWYYLIFGGVAIAAAFIGLIIRVIKNVIEKAVMLKEEQDFTI